MSERAERLCERLRRALGCASEEAVPIAQVGLAFMIEALVELLDERGVFDMGAAGRAGGSGGGGAAPSEAPAESKPGTAGDDDGLAFGSGPHNICRESSELIPGGTEHRCLLGAGHPGPHFDPLTRTAWGYPGMEPVAWGSAGGGAPRDEVPPIAAREVADHE